MPDLKWQALAKGKLVFILYLNFLKLCIEKIEKNIFIWIFPTTYLNFSKPFFCMLGISQHLSLL